MSRIRNKAHEFLNAYERMNNIFKTKFGYNLYFIGGTLLGYIRENDFLENDKDMDISYFSKYTNVIDVRKEILEIISTLIDSGEELYFIRNLDYSVVKNYFRWRVDERDRIDVMPTWTQDGMIYRPTFVSYEGTSDIILPLKKEKFYDHDVFIPNKPEIKLANVYGDNWKTPDRGFKKKTRWNDSTKRVVQDQLLFRKDAWPLIKKTKQWQEELTFREKLFVRLLSFKKHKFLALLVPNRKKLKKGFFKKLRLSLNKKGNSN